MTVHGDDVTSCGTRSDLLRLKEQCVGKFEVTAEILGPEKDQASEIRVRNRIVRWTDAGLESEPDQRHAEIGIRDFGLEGMKVNKFNTPRTKEDLNKFSTPKGVTRVEVLEEPTRQRQPLTGQSLRA